MPIPIVPRAFPWLDLSRYSFSVGVDTGSTVHVSGTTASARDHAGKVTVSGDMAAQATLAWEKILAVLAAAGLGPSDVVRAVEYVPVDALAHRDDAAAVRADALGGASPAVNTVVVEGLLRPEALVEIEVVASRGGETGPGDGVVHLPTLLPHDDDGRLVGEGDVVAQTRCVLERAAALLAELGLGLGNVVTSVEMFHPDARTDYRATGEPRRELLGPDFPAATGICQRQVAADPRVLVALDVVASRHPRRIVNPGWATFDRFTFSPGVRAGDMVWVAGTAAFDPESGALAHEGDVGGQCEHVLSTIGAVVEEAGGAMSDLVATVDYVAPGGLAGYKETAGVRRRLLGPTLPASTGVRCHGLLAPGFLIETNAVAALGS